MVSKEHVNALRRTWDIIAQDIADTGERMNAQQCAETCADYVYMYGHERDTEAKKISAEIMGLTPKQFKQLAKEAALSF